MILLECFHQAVEEVLLKTFENAESGGKPEKTEYTIADYDGAVYTISNSEDKNKLVVSISLKFYETLKKYDVVDVLKREYGEYLLPSPKPMQSASLEFNLETIGSANWRELARKAANLKRNCFAAVFEKFFDYQSSGDDRGSQKAVIHFRDNETLYIQASSDRVTVIFSTIFQDADDVVLSKVFIQAFVEVRQKHNRAPQVIYSHKNPPAELNDSDAAVGDNIAYITFVLFPRHTKPDVRNNTIDLIHTLRNYLHYHIKCNKAYLHMRMRSKTAEFLKMLNRARIDQKESDGGSPSTNRRGISGKFTR